MFLGALLAYELTRTAATPHDEHVRLAYALLQGHPYVDATPVWEEVVVKGHAFILHPPLAAILCAPFVLFGIYDQTAISVLVGALGVALAWRMCERIDNPEYHYDGATQGGDGYATGTDHRENRQHALWLTLFFAFGTVFWYEATLGASWGLCLTLSTIPTFLALTELFGKRRAWVVGTWAALAALARYDLVLVCPVYLLWLLLYPPTEGRPSYPRTVVAFAIPLQLAVIAYLGFNLWRFGVPYDPSLWMWYAHDAAGGLRYPWGPFSIHYLPLGIFTALFAGPHFQMAWPWLRPIAFGQSLLLTSPAFLLVARARNTTLIASALLLAMAPALTVWSNGVEQFGARYWIQALPFLLALMTRSPIDRFAKTLILTSILFCAWGTYSIRAYGWG